MSGIFFRDKALFVFMTLLFSVVINCGNLAGGDNPTASNAMPEFKTPGQIADGVSANSNAGEFSALPADIGVKFLKASLTPASLKVLAMPTPKDPTQKYNLVGGPKNDSGELSHLLLLKSTTDPVSQEEIKALENYLFAYPLPRANIQNYHFRRMYVPAMLEWVFERTKNPALVEHAIRMAYSTAAHRNDRFGAENLNGQGPLPLWPHYRGSKWEDGKLIVPTSIADTSAISWLTVPARIIARHPELWDKTLDGATYKQIALDLIREAFKTTDWVMKDFRDPATNLLKSPDYWVSEPKGEVPQWNRVFPFMTGTIPLIEALEAFHIEPQRAAMLDKVNGAMIDFFWTNVRRTETDGHVLYLYPYGVARLKDSADQVEDFGHGSFDGRCLEVFYESGRYHFTKEQVQNLADTVAFCCRGPGSFTKRLNGSGLEKPNYDYIAGMEGHIWYAAYRKEIKTCLVDYLFARLNPDKLDSCPVWEILKLREQANPPTREK